MNEANEWGEGGPWFRPNAEGRRERLQTCQGSFIVLNPRARIKPVTIHVLAFAFWITFD